MRPAHLLDTSAILADLLIAACAKTHGLKLVYRDKHIEGIPEKALSQIKLPSKNP